MGSLRSRSSGSTPSLPTAPRQEPAMQGGGSSPYDPLFAAKEQQYNLPSGLLKAIAQKESNFRPDARGKMLTSGSHKGHQAMGMFQFMPNTWKSEGHTGDPFNPYDATEAAARKLDKDFTKYKTIGGVLGAYYGTGQAPAGDPTTSQYAEDIVGLMNGYLGASGGQGVVQQPQQPPPAQEKGYDPRDYGPAPKVEGLDGSNNVRGFKHALQTFPQLGYGAVAGAAATAESALGEGGLATGVKNWGVEGFQKYEKEHQLTSKKTDSLTHSWNRATEKGDFGALVEWSEYALGYVVGNILTLVATGGVGGMAGKLALKGAVKKSTGKIITGLVAKQMAKGSTKELAVKEVAKNLGKYGTLGATAYGMEGGEIGGGLAAKSVARGTPLTGYEIGRGLATTLASGTLEFATDLLALSGLGGGLKGMMPGKIAKMPGWKGKALRGAGIAATVGPVEGGTEFGQTYLEEYGQGNPIDDNTFRQAVDSAGIGFMSGPVVGTVGGLMSTPKRDDKDVSPTALGEPKQLSYRDPDPLIAFPDGSVGKQSDVDAHIAKIPAEKQPAARAELYGLPSAGLAPIASMKGHVDRVATQLYGPDTDKGTAFAKLYMAAIAGDVDALADVTEMLQTDPNPKESSEAIRESVLSSIPFLQVEFARTQPGYTPDMFDSDAALAKQKQNARIQSLDPDPDPQQAHGIYNMEEEAPPTKGQIEAEVPPEENTVAWYHRSNELYDKYRAALGDPNVPRSGNMEEAEAIRRQAIEELSTPTEGTPYIEGPAKGLRRGDPDADRIAYDAALADDKASVKKKGIEDRLKGIEDRHFTDQDADYKKYRAAVKESRNPKNSPHIRKQEAARAERIIENAKAKLQKAIQDYREADQRVAPPVAEKLDTAPTLRQKTLPGMARGTKSETSTPNKIAAKAKARAAKTKADTIAAPLVAKVAAAKDAAKAAKDTARAARLAAKDTAKAARLAARAASTDKKPKGSYSSSSFDIYGRKLFPHHPKDRGTVLKVEDWLAGLEDQFQVEIEFTVVATYDDLPDRIKNHLPRGIRGAYHEPIHDESGNKGIYLVADQIYSQEEAIFVAMHEAAHRGLASIFGDSIDLVLEEIYRTNPEIKENVQNRMAVNPSLDLVDAIEEELADMAYESYDAHLLHTQGWAKLVKLINDWMKSIWNKLDGTKGMKPMVWTNKMVATLLTKATSKGIKDRKIPQRTMHWPAPKSSGGSGTTEIKLTPAEIAFIDSGKFESYLDDFMASSDYPIKSAYHPTINVKGGVMYVDDVNMDVMQEFMDWLGDTIDNRGTLPPRMRSGRFLREGSPSNRDPKGSRAAEVPQEALEYESRLFGGAYSAGRLRIAAKDAPIRKMIEQARARYNQHRVDAGLEPITDWGQKLTLENSLSKIRRNNRDPKGSRAAEVEDETTPVADVLQEAKEKGVEAFSKVGEYTLKNLSTLGQLIDHIKGVLPSAEKFDTVVRRMQAATNITVNEASPIAAKWGALEGNLFSRWRKKVTDLKRLTRIMTLSDDYGFRPDLPLKHLANSWGIGQADNPAQAAARYDELQVMWKEAGEINPVIQEIYKEQAELSTKVINQVIDAMEKNYKTINDSKRRNALIKELRARFRPALNGRPYLARKRYGDYIVIITGHNGAKGVFGFSTKGEAKRMGIELAKEYGTADKPARVTHIKSGQIFKNLDGADQALINKINSEILEKVTDADEAKVLVNTIQEIYIAALPEMAGAKRLIRRKDIKVKGYSEDYLRTWSEANVSLSRLAAKLNHMDDLRNAVDDAGREAGRNSTVFAVTSWVTSKDKDAKPSMSTAFFATAADKADYITKLNKDKTSDYEIVEGKSSDILEKSKKAYIERFGDTWEAEFAPVEKEHKDNPIRNIKSPDDSIQATTYLNLLRDRYSKLLEHNPRGPISNLLVNIGFVNYLGFTPAFAFMNMTQVAILTFPKLASLYGGTGAYKAIQEGYEFAFKNMGVFTTLSKNALLNKDDALSIAKFRDTDGKKLDPNGEMYLLMQYLLDHGKLDFTQGSELNQITEDSWKSTRHIMKAASWLAHPTEVLNRIVTAHAAYNLARKSGKSVEEARKSAVEVVDTTQLDYSSENRPPILRHPSLRVMFQFRQFSQQVAWQIGKATAQALKSQSPEVRRQQKAYLAYLLASSFVFAGVRGLPFAGSILILASMLFGDEGDDFEYELREGFKEILGDTFGTVMGSGAFTLLGIDPSANVGLGDLAPGSNMNTRASTSTRDTLQQMVFDVLGPTAAMSSNVARGIDTWEKGDPYQGVEQMLPKAFRTPMTAIRLGDRGLTTTKGVTRIPGTDISAMDMVITALGLKTTAISEMQSKVRNVQDKEDLIKFRATVIRNNINTARRLGDIQEEMNWESKREEYNREHPSSRIKPIRNKVAARAQGFADRSDGIAVNNKQLKIWQDELESDRW